MSMFFGAVHESANDPKRSFKSSALDVQFRVADYARQAELRRHHGSRRLAAESWPRAV